MSQKEQSNNELQVPTTNLTQRFLFGAVSSGLLVFVYLTLSLDMTQMPLAEFGTMKLMVAIAVPILCGLASVAAGNRAVKLITAALESVNLPF